METIIKAISAIYVFYVYKYFATLYVLCVFVSFFVRQKGELIVDRATYVIIMFKRSECGVQGVSIKTIHLEFYPQDKIEVAYNSHSSMYSF